MVVGNFFSEGVNAHLGLHIVLKAKGRRPALPAMSAFLQLKGQNEKEAGGEWERESAARRRCE